MIKIANIEESLIKSTVFFFITYYYNGEKLNKTMNRSVYSDMSVREYLFTFHESF